MLKRCLTTTIHQDPLDALVENLLPIVFGPSIRRGSRRRVIRLRRRHVTISAALARSKAAEVPAWLAHGYDRQ